MMMEFGEDYGPEKQCEESDSQFDLRNETNIPKYGCSDCEYKTNDKTVLISHIKTYHIELQNDSKDDKISLEEKPRNRSTTSKFDKFKCEYKNCDKSYGARKHLSRHITNIHLKSSTNETVEEVSGDKDIIMDSSQRNLIKTQNDMKIEEVDIDEEDTFEHDFNDDKSKDNSIIGKNLQNVITKPKISHLYKKEIPNNASKSDDDVGLGNCAKYGCSDCEFKTNDKKDLIFHIRKSHTLNL